MSIYEMLAKDMQERHQAYCALTVGMVTDINDPDKKNRVKVRLFNRSDSQQETDFLRVMTPASGKEFGFFDLPEVGDEVLVGFLDGDFSAPYVLGSLWNPQSPAPVTIQDGKNEIRMLKSKTAHKLEFNDGEDTPGVTLISAIESALYLDDKEKKITLTEKKKENYLTIDIDGGTVTMEAKSKLVLKCGGASIEMDGSSGQISIKTSGNITIEGQKIDMSAKTNIGIKATGQLDMEAQAPASLKGAIVKIN